MPVSTPIMKLQAIRNPQDFSEFFSVIEHPHTSEKTHKYQTKHSNEDLDNNNRLYHS